MANPTYANQGWVARTISKARSIIDGNPSDSTGNRMSRYNETYVLAPMTGEPLLADEGALMMSSMLPGATALQLGLSAAYAATAAAFVFKNNSPFGSSNPRCHLRDIHFTCSVPPTSGTSLQYATAIDSANRTPTTISGLGAPGTPATVTAYQAPSVCTNIDENPSINGVCFFPLSIAAGAPITIPAQGAAARILVGNGILRGQIPVVLDDYRIVFGATDRPAGQLVTAAPAGASRIVEPHPAVTIGPQEHFILYLWAPSNVTAGLAFTGFDVSWFER